MSSQDLYFEKKYTAGEHFLDITYVGDDQTEINIKTDLPGIYQVKNVKTVLTALYVLKQVGWNIPGTAVKEALGTVKKRTGLYGRWEIIHNNPTIVLEVAHNPDGIQQMLLHLQNTSYEGLHLIIGMVKDKDISTVLELLPRNAHYYFTQAHIPRALPASELQQKAALFSLKGAAYEDVNTALQKALEAAAKNDLLIVCGSIFLVAEVNKNLVLHPA